MSENLDKNPMDSFTKALGETQKLETRIDMSARNKIQVALMKIMLGEDPGMDPELTWAAKYRQVVSDIIDDPNNTEIRSTINQISQELAERAVKGSDTDYIPVAELVRNHPLLQAKTTNGLENAA